MVEEEFCLSNWIVELEEGKAIHPDKVKEFIKRLKERDKEVIIWARQWAETVDDEQVLEFWNKKWGMNIFIDRSLRKKDVTDLDKLAGEKLTK